MGMVAWRMLFLHGCSYGEMVVVTGVQRLETGPRAYFCPGSFTAATFSAPSIVNIDKAPKMTREMKAPICLLLVAAFVASGNNCVDSEAPLKGLGFHSLRCGVPLLLVCPHCPLQLIQFRTLKSLITNAGDLCPVRVVFRRCY